MWNLIALSFSEYNLNDGAKEHEMGRACSTNGEGEGEKMKKKDAYRILVGKPEGNRPLGRQRRR
jgi:hypothetical protein